MSSDETIEIARAELMKAYDVAVDAADRQTEQPKVKYCKGCDQTKPIDQFGKSIRMKDGIAFYCFVCDRRRQAEYYHRAKHRRREIARQRAAAGNASGKLKRCKTCGNLKPYSEFYARNDSGDGKSAHCKKCMQTYARFYYGELRHRKRAAHEVNAMGTL